MLTKCGHYCCDFSAVQILAATTARRLAVIDVERGEQVMTYDNCEYLPLMG